MGILLGLFLMVMSLLIMVFTLLHLETELQKYVYVMDKKKEMIAFREYAEKTNLNYCKEHTLATILSLTKVKAKRAVVVALWAFIFTVTPLIFVYNAPEEFMSLVKNPLIVFGLCTISLGILTRYKKWKESKEKEKIDMEEEGRHMKE